MYSLQPSLKVLLFVNVSECGWSLSQKNVAFLIGQTPSAPPIQSKSYILKTFEDIPYLLEGAGAVHVSYTKYIPNVANEIQIVFDVIDAAINA